jgi:hypothetical protein
MGEMRMALSALFVTSHCRGGSWKPTCSFGTCELVDLQIEELNLTLTFQ